MIPFGHFTKNSTVFVLFLAWNSKKIFYSLIQRPVKFRKKPFKGLKDFPSIRKFVKSAVIWRNPKIIPNEGSEFISTLIQWTLNFCLDVIITHKNRPFTNFWLMFAFVLKTLNQTKTREWIAMWLSFFHYYQSYLAISIFSK